MHSMEEAERASGIHGFLARFVNASSGNKCFNEHDAAKGDFQRVNKLRPHPEERAAARVSKDGRESVPASILRDAVLRTAPQDEV
jgi:hypothetical protein